MANTPQKPTDKKEGDKDTSKGGHTHGGGCCGGH